MQTLFDDLSGGSEDTPKKTKNKKAIVRSGARKGRAATEEPLPERAGPSEPLSVSTFIAALNVILSEFRARVAGEVTSAKRGPTGHWYFTLKDPDDGSILNCVIWRSNYTLSGVHLEDGLAVVVSGVPDVYAPNGRLSFKADTIELVGEGALRVAYLKLKEKLSREGVFDESRKRPLPAFPRRIGVITSTKSGTVIHDFTNNLGRHGFALSVCDVRVEGAEAVRDLLGGIRAFKNRPIDALVIIRGGGSFESLSAFDNEALVRAIASFPVPVVAGIGHHEDITLAALAADFGVSTPTAAAHLLNRTWDEALRTIEQAERLIFDRFAKSVRASERLIEVSGMSIRRTFSLIEDRYVSLERRLVGGIARLSGTVGVLRRRQYDTTARIATAFPRTLRECRRRAVLSKQIVLSRFERLVEAQENARVALARAIAPNNPERALRLGYSISRIKGVIVRSVNDVQIDDILEVRVADGSIETIVKEARH